MDELFHFEWDQAKADANASKHGITFELASTVFFDGNLLTVADLDHGDGDERWFSVGIAGSGAALSVVYLWSGAGTDDGTTVRLISARRATRRERERYQENL